MTHALQSVDTDDTAVSAEIDAFLRAEKVIEAINAVAGPNGLPPIPKNYVFRKRDREAVAVAMHSAFELIGGLPAFIQWGANNPDKFYILWSKLAQSDTLTPSGNTYNFVSPLPANPLDLVNVSRDGFVMQADVELPE